MLLNTALDSRRHNNMMKTDCHQKMFKEDGIWFSNTYEKLVSGVLSLILVFSVWVVLYLFGAAVEAILRKK
jgi:hypothetical protein